MQVIFVTWIGKGYLQKAWQDVDGEAMIVAFMDLNNGLEALNLEGSLVIPQMDGPYLSPIDDESQAKQLEGKIAKL